MRKNNQAKNVVRGMLLKQCRMGEEQFHRSAVRLAATVAACNQFMNSVDRMDEIRAGAPTRSCERRVFMSILSWLLDLAVNNTYAVYNETEARRQ